VTDVVRWEETMNICGKHAMTAAIICFGRKKFNLCLLLLRQW